MQTAKLGELVVGHQDGPLRYVVARARFGIRSPLAADDPFGLWVDVETRRPGPEHRMEVLGAVHLSAGNIRVATADVAAILERTFEFEIDPEAPFRNRAAWANLYVSSHTQPHNNRIAIRKDARGGFVLTWFGECEDIDYYDSRAKGNSFGIAISRYSSGMTPECSEFHSLRSGRC